jgi:hypothetical protein
VEGRRDHLPASVPFLTWFHINKARVTFLISVKRETS